MRIGELSRRTSVPARMLRYYEEQGLLQPARDTNGYRSYGSGTVELVQQIRGLLDAGLTTAIVRRILPFLEHPGNIAVHPDCLPETAELLQQEADRIQRRIDCLARNRDAIHGYLDGIREHSRVSETPQSCSDGLSPPDNVSVETPRAPSARR